MGLCPQIQSLEDRIWRTPARQRLKASSSFQKPVSQTRCWKGLKEIYFWDYYVKWEIQHVVIDVLGRNSMYFHVTWIPPLNGISAVSHWWRGRQVNEQVCLCPSSLYRVQSLSSALVSVWNEWETEEAQGREAAHHMVCPSLKRDRLKIASPCLLCEHQAGREKWSGVVSASPLLHSSSTGGRRGQLLMWASSSLLAESPKRIRVFSGSWTGQQTGGLGAYLFLAPPRVPQLCCFAQQFQIASWQVQTWSWRSLTSIVANVGVGFIL